MAKNYLIYPCKTMRITQSYTGTTSHLPHTTGDIKDYPIDEGGADTGRDYMYCPCDEMIVKRIYGVGTGGTNTIWLESTSKVIFADGTKGYFTLLVIHPDDDDLKKIKVGQKFTRKQKICREGKDGATGYHFHFSGGKGKFGGNGWLKNNKNKYVLNATGKEEKPEKLFYIDEKFTKVVSTKGLKFKPMPTYATGNYKVNTSVLNVREGADTSEKKVGTLILGKKITVDKVIDDWGRIGKKRWVNLDYCKKI